LLKKKPATPTYLSTGCVNVVVVDGCTMKISKEECRHQPLFFSTPTRIDASINAEEKEKKTKGKIKNKGCYEVEGGWVIEDDVDAQ